MTGLRVFSEFIPQARADPVPAVTLRFRQSWAGVSVLHSPTRASSLPLAHPDQTGVAATF